MLRLTQPRTSFLDVGVTCPYHRRGPWDGDSIVFVIVMSGKPGVAALAAVDRRLCR